MIITRQLCAMCVGFGILLAAACGGDAETSSGGNGAAAATAGAAGSPDAGSTGGTSGTGGLAGAAGEAGAAGSGGTAGAAGVSGMAGEAGYAAGGPCTYDDVAGAATVLTITEAPSTEYNCTTNPKKITFSFSPTDASKAKASDASQAYMVGAGANPPESCLVPNGIAVSMIIDAKRRDIAKGTCTPTIYELTLPQPDLCLDDCFK